MAGSSQKRIYYVRAVFNNGAQVADTLEVMVRKVLKNRAMDQTEILMPSVGTLAVRERDVFSADDVSLAIGLGVKDEAMATMGLGVTTVADTNAPETPPPGRVFKLSDSFCVIDDNEVLFCNDGGMSRQTLEAYLKALVGLGNFGAAATSFGLISRLDQDKARTLAVEGVKEIHISAASYAASQMGKAQKGKKSLRDGFQAFWKGVREEFLEEAPNKAARDVISKSFDELNVTTVIGVKKGSRGEPMMYQALQTVAQEAMDDAPPGADVGFVTTKGNPISADTLSLSTTKSIKRLMKQNDLDFTDAWNKIKLFREELFESKRWKV